MSCLCMSRLDWDYNGTATLGIALEHLSRRPKDGDSQLGDSSQSQSESAGWVDGAEAWSHGSL